MSTISFGRDAAFDPSPKLAMLSAAALAFWEAEKSPDIAVDKAPIIMLL